MDDGTIYSYGCLPLSFQSTGWSALFFSAERGDVTTTESLLKAGANAVLEDKVQVDVWLWSNSQSLWIGGGFFCEFLSYISPSLPSSPSSIPSVCSSFQNGLTAIHLAAAKRPSSRLLHWDRSRRYRKVCQVLQRYTPAKSHHVRTTPALVHVIQLCFSCLYL